MQGNSVAENEDNSDQFELHSVIDLSPNESPNFLVTNVLSRAYTHALVTLESETTLDYFTAVSFNNCSRKHIGQSNPQLNDAEILNLSRHCEEVIDEFVQNRVHSDDCIRLDINVILNRVPCRVLRWMKKEQSARDCYEFFFDGHERCWKEYFKTVNLTVLSSTDDPEDKEWWRKELRETMRLMHRPDSRINARTLGEMDDASRQRIRKSIRRNDIGIRKHNERLNNLAGYTA